MSDEEFSTYRDGRYAEALTYYDTRARSAKALHSLSSGFVIVASVSLAPLLLKNPTLLWWNGAAKLTGQGLASILAPAIAMASGWAALCRYQEAWLRCRSAWDALRHEVYWRDARVHEYRDASDRNALFVQRVEDLISREGTEWLGNRKQGPSSGQPVPGAG